MTMSLHIKPGDHHASLINDSLSCLYPLTSRVPKETILLEAVALYVRSMLLNRFSKSTVVVYFMKVCTACSANPFKADGVHGADRKWSIPFCFVNSSPVNTLPLSNLELSNLEWVWVTVACELHPPPSLAIHCKVNISWVASAVISSSSDLPGTSWHVTNIGPCKKYCLVARIQNWEKKFCSCQEDNHI